MDKPSSQELFARDREWLEDFWGRRKLAARHQADFAVFGRAARLSSNEPRLLEAVEHSVSLFSRVPARPGPLLDIRIVVDRLEPPDGEPVEDAGDHLAYRGEDDWITISLGPFGSAWADLGRSIARGVVDERLAARPDLVSRWLLNTLLLNFCLAQGYAMIHASCLVREGRALLLMAPHNTGKSTAALQLALNGFALVSDSMIHIVPESAASAPLLAGFPTRRIKLRADMAPRFAPWLAERGVTLMPEAVRDETKYVLDLSRVDPALVCLDAVRPTHTTLCLLDRNPVLPTSWKPAEPEAVWRAVMANSLYDDAWPVWERNLEAIGRLVGGARCLHLTLGRDPERLVPVIEELWDYGAG